MPELFKDIIPSILQTKKNVFVDEMDYRDYKPFIVNRAFQQTGIAEQWLVYLSNL